MTAFRPARVRPEQVLPAVPEVSARRPVARMASLDGLRGLAASVVVLHHCLLTWPPAAAQQLGPDTASAAWWITYTPLHLAWAGGEAVLVFFLLSGLVLILPMLGPARRRTWGPWYAQRLVRLYLPVAGAILLTGVALWFFPRTGGAGWSWWMNAHAGPLSIRELVHDAALLGGTGWSNSALWSLRYEVLFSLALPVFVVLARSMAAPLVATVPMALWGVGWAAANGHEVLSHLFVFAVGGLLATRLDVLRSWGAAIAGARWAAPAWWGLALLAAALLLAEWWLKALGTDPRWWLPYGRPVAVAGAVVLVFLALHWPGMRRVLSSRPLSWSGGISFSLYLVHEPVVVSVATLVPSDVRGLLVTLVAGTTVSLALAVLLHRLVERPSRRLASRVGRMRRWGPEDGRRTMLPTGRAPVAAGPDAGYVPG